MDTAAQIVLGVGASTFFHPIAYAKVLIQLGHEPIPPVLTKNIFGNKVLMYPNILKYIGHIKEKDGFFGLYRGLYFRIVTNLVNNCTTAKVYMALTEREEACDGDQIPPSTTTEPEDSPAKLFKDTMNTVISNAAGIVISQPFHVIFIRSVSQFIGGEDKYSGLISSFSEIWKNEGIAGFFSGLVPHFLGEVLTICLSNIVTYLINNFVFNTNPTQDKELRGYSGTVSNLLVSQMTYPFTVVANVMAVSGSGLAAGRTNDYSGWMVCWASLASQNELKRGSSMFWRQFRGQQPPVIRSDTSQSRFHSIAD